MGSLFLLQGSFPTQESNRGLLRCRRILYQLSYQGSPRRALTCLQTLASVFLSLKWEHDLCPHEKAEVHVLRVL